jgi:hypothetical protein
VIIQESLGVVKGLQPSHTLMKKRKSAGRMTKLLDGARRSA